MAAVLRADFAQASVGLVTPAQKKNLANLHDWLIDKVGLTDREQVVALTNYQQGRFGRMPNHILLVTTDRVAFTHDGGLRSIPLADIDTSRIGLNAGLVNGEVTLLLRTGEQLNFRRGMSIGMQEVAHALTSAATAPPPVVSTSPDPVVAPADEADVPADDGAPEQGSGQEPLRGYGDDIVDFREPLQGFLVLAISGNRERSAFSVWALGPQLEQVDLLVNQTQPYDGVVLVGHRAPVRALKVDASGHWSVRILTAEEIPVLGSGCSGRGDAVVLMSSDFTPSPEARIARIEIPSSAEGAAAVSVWAWGTAPDLLVNGISPYGGTVVIPAGTQVLDITAPGPWSVTLQ